MTYGKWRGRNIENGARFRVSFCFVFFVASKCGLGRLELSSFIPSDGVCVVLSVIFASRTRRDVVMDGEWYCFALHF